MNLKKNIFLAGARRRNPGLLKHFHFLLETQSWSLERLKSYQLQELKKLLQLANQHSTFYRNYFRLHGFDPAIKSLEDLKRLPPISKEQLVTDNRDVHTDLKFKHNFFCETSGSSGQVLTFLRNEEWDSANRAAIMRGHSWHGVAPWDKNIYFWGYNIDPKKQLKTRVLDTLQNRYRLFDYSPDTLKELFDRLKSTTYMHGYSSMIYELAKVYKDQKLEFEVPQLKMIKGTSEKIYPHYSDTVKEVFGQRMISEYGAAEASIMAFECTEGSMHMTMENVIVEVEDNEILITNLVAQSFPIIRYRLGDFVKLRPESERCPCGLEHPIIEDIEGRVGKNIYGWEQRYPSLVLYYIFKNLFFEKGQKFNYQCIQEEKGNLQVLIKESFTQSGEKLIREEFKKYFKEDIVISIEFSKDFHTYQSKLKDFISKLD
jgi:phenylacetate-CoA ligase